jgi:hypothetical protein
MLFFNVHVLIILLCFVFVFGWILLLIDADRDPEKQETKISVVQKCMRLVASMPGQKVQLLLQQKQQFQRTGFPGHFQPAATTALKRISGSPWKNSPTTATMPPHTEDAAAAATAMGIELQQQLPFNHNITHLADNSYGVHEMGDMDCFNHHHHQHKYEDQQQQSLQNGQQCFDYSSLPNSPYPPTPDLLNLFHLPRSIPFSNPTQKTANYQNPMVFLGDVNPTGPDHSTGASVLYDPLLHLNLPPQPPLFSDLFQSLTNGYDLPGSRNNASLFDAGGDESCCPGSSQVLTPHLLKVI